MNTFKERLLELLAKETRTQTEICKEIGIPRYRLTHWKSGYTEPSLDDLIKIADYFDVTIDYLLGRQSW